MTTIVINPIPCPRPRIALRGRFPVAYYPKAYAEWKTEAAALITEARTEPPATGPLILTARFAVKRPKSTKLTAPKADIDNYLKALMDAMTAAEVWEDDAQVVVVNASKEWAAPDSEGYITFHIERET